MTTIRPYCACGATLKYDGRHPFKEAIINYWRAEHFGKGHGITTAAGASRARARAEQAAISEEGQNDQPIQGAGHPGCRAGR